LTGRCTQHLPTVRAWHIFFTTQSKKVPDTSVANTNKTYCSRHLRPAAHDEVVDNEHAGRFNRQTEVTKNILKTHISPYKCNQETSWPVKLIQVIVMIKPIF